MKIIENYKNMTIYYNRYNILCFGNRSYTYLNCKSVRAAKNRITRYINKLTPRDQKRLKYISY